MAHRRSTNKQNIHDIKFKYRIPTLNRFNKDESTSNKFTLLIVGLIIIICILL